MLSSSVWRCMLYVTRCASFVCSAVELTARIEATALSPTGGVAAEGRRTEEPWRQCQTCEQDFTGAMQVGLAEAWRSRVSGQAAESLERLLAEGNLALSLLHQGKYAQAERVLRDLHVVMMRVLGAEHPGTLTTAGNLAAALSRQGKYAHAWPCGLSPVPVVTDASGRGHWQFGIQTCRAARARPGAAARGPDPDPRRGPRASAS